MIDPRGVLREFGLEVGGRNGNTRLGQHGRNTLPGAAGAPGRKREAGRKCARRAGHARRHDRRREGGDAVRGAGVNGVHDMGGMHGLGRIQYEQNEPVFHAPWEGRVFALDLAAGAWRKWSLDALRHQIELIPAADYLRMSYYEKWLTAVTERLVESGLVTALRWKAANPRRARSQSLRRLRPPWCPRCAAPERSPVERYPLIRTFIPASECARATSIRPGTRGCLATLARNREWSNAITASMFFPTPPLIAGREAAARLFSALRRAGAVGRPGIALRLCLHRSLGRLS